MSEEKDLYIKRLEEQVAGLEYKMNVMDIENMDSKNTLKIQGTYGMCFRQMVVNIAWQIEPPPDILIDNSDETEAHLTYCALELLKLHDGYCQNLDTTQDYESVIHQYISSINVLRRWVKEKKK